MQKLNVGSNLFQVIDKINEIIESLNTGDDDIANISIEDLILSATKKDLKDEGIYVTQEESCSKDLIDVYKGDKK